MIPMTSTLYSYDVFLTDEGGIFRDCVFPDGIDKDTVITTILLEAGELEPLYKDPEFMRMAIANWSQKWYQTFERWHLALTEKYNPLHNYDRYEEWTDKTDSSVTSDATTSTRKSAFDSSSLTPYDSTDYDNKDTVDATGIHNGHLYGNIGVTTSAQMIEGDVTTRMRFNLYNMIADCFKTELCLLVY